MQKIETIITQADLQRMEAQNEDLWLEVEDGEIVEVERNMTLLHVIIIQNLFLILHSFVKANKLGSLYIDGARYILVGTPQGVQRAYKPDLSFMRTGRIPKDFDWSGDFVGAPDLAVEVVSPGQTNKILLPKVTRYLQAGTEEVWLIYPWSKTLYQYRYDAEEPFAYKETDTIHTAALFPNLKLVLGDLFVTEVE